MFLKFLLTFAGVAVFGSTLLFINDLDPRSKKALNTPRFTCKDCRRAALYVINNAQAAAEQPTEELNRPGRRNSLITGENDVLSSLDSACDTFTTFVNHQSCQRALTPFRADLEESLFNIDPLSGYKGFDRRMCADILRLCDPHEIDSVGEL